MWKQVIDIWQGAMKFHRMNIKTLVPVLPFLFFPLIGNLMHSILIRQYLYESRLEPVKALRQAWELSLAFLWLKTRFNIIDTVFEGVPVLDEVIDVKYAQYAAMLPNVLVFEGLTGRACIIRSKEIVKGEGIAARAIFTGPAILFLCTLILWTGFVTTYKPIFPLAYLLLPTAYILGPLSAATNTMLYLVLRGETKL